MTSVPRTAVHSSASLRIRRQLELLKNAVMWLSYGLAVLWHSLCMSVQPHRHVFICAGLVWSRCTHCWLVPRSCRPS